MLKDRAKQSLKKSYWMVFLACLIAGFLGGNDNGSGGASGILNSFSSILNSSGSTGSYGSYGSDPSPEFFIVFIVVMLLIMLFATAAGFAVTVFLGNPIKVGLCRFLMEARQGNCSLASLFWAFREGRYMKIVKVMFVYSLHIFLWSLLFVIPGIIKGLEYYYVPYILAENPDIGTDRALALSKTLTDGEKGDIFVLGLSFIGWEILGLLACCIGSMFITPYIMATDAELYAYVRERAIYHNISSDAELPGFHCPPPMPVQYYGQPYQNMYQQPDQNVYQQPAPPPYQNPYQPPEDQQPTDPPQDDVNPPQN